MLFICVSMNQMTERKHHDGVLSCAFFFSTLSLSYIIFFSLEVLFIFPFFPLWIKLLYVYPFLIDCALFSLRTCHAHTLKILNPKTLSFCSRLHITRIGNTHAGKNFLEKCEVTSPSHEQVFFLKEQAMSKLALV